MQVRGPLLCHEHEPEGWWRTHVCPETQSTSTSEFTLNAKLIPNSSWTVPPMMQRLSFNMKLGSIRNFRFCSLIFCCPVTLCNMWLILLNDYHKNSSKLQNLNYLYKITGRNLNTKWQDASSPLFWGYKQLDWRVILHTSCFILKVMSSPLVLRSWISAQSLSDWLPEIVY